MLAALQYTGNAANGGGVINVARGCPGLSGYGRQQARYHEKKPIFGGAEQRDGTDIINVSENNGGRMWEKPWLNRVCLELVRPALQPRTDRGP